MSHSKRVVEKTKTYQLRLAQIRALNPPRIAAEDVAPKPADPTTPPEPTQRQETTRTLKRPVPRPLPGFDDVVRNTTDQPINAPPPVDDYAPASAVPPKKKQRRSRLTAKEKGKGRVEGDAMDINDDALLQMD